MPIQLYFSAQPDSQGKYYTIEKVHIEITLWHYENSYNTNDEITILDLMKAGF